MTTSPMVGSTFFGLDISQFATRFMAIRRRISKRVLMLEFGPASLLLAEATLTHAGVKLRHVSTFPLPPEALDRGVPAEPLKMAGLLKDFCTEKKIPAHRVAVVLPPELAFRRLIDLPANLTTDEAREYVLNPVNGLQIPFPLTQTDFDLFPILLPPEQQSSDESRLFMLTAVPEALVNPIVEMLQAADLELQILELGTYSQLRNHAAELITLPPQQVDLVLELLPDCSNLVLVCCSGLIGSERLAAIRNLPELDIEPDQLSVALETGLTAENLLLKDENYLPISDLDLKVLVSDLRDCLDRFHFKFPCTEIRRLILTGVNSSHPLIADLLEKMLGIHTVISRPSDITGLVELSLDDLLLQSGLGRLIGLGLGLLPKNQFLACSLEGHGLNNQELRQQNNAMAIVDLLNTSEAQMVTDIVSVEAGSDELMTDVIKDNAASNLDYDIESTVSLGSGDFSEEDSSTGAVDHPDDLPSILVEIAEDQVLTNSSITPPYLETLPPGSTLGGKYFNSPSDQEGQSKSALQVDPPLNSVTADDKDLLEEQLSSTQVFSPDDADNMISSTTNSSLKNSSLDELILLDEINSSSGISLPNTDGPSIVSMKPVQQGLENEVVFGDDSSEWPSISSNIQEDIIESQNVVENVNQPISSEEELGFDLMDAAISSGLSEDSEQSSQEYSDSSLLLEDALAPQEEELLISDSNSSDEVIDSLEDIHQDVPAGGDSYLADESSSLGELRFANDD